MGMIYTRGTISGITHADRDNGVNPFQRAADLIEFEDSSAVRAWISTNSLTIITRDQAQAIVMEHQMKQMLAKHLMGLLGQVVPLVQYKLDMLAHGVTAPLPHG